MTRLEQDSVLRLFQQLHQDVEDGWIRASGSCLCVVCGLEYRMHHINPVTESDIFEGDHRLCNGLTVHL